MAVGDPRVGRVRPGGPGGAGYPGDVGRIRIGISGWSYPGWRGDFYPAGLAHRQELAYASERFTSIELNGSFYSLQRPSSYATWREQTPEDFVFAVKGSRFITHLKKLAGVEVALANFFASGVLGLGPKLGPVLWQLPPTLRFDPERLSAFFDLLPRTTGEVAALAQHHDAKVPPDRALTAAEDDRPVRYALEVRHPSLAAAEAVELLRAHDVSCVVADSAGRFPFVEEVTSDFVYVRLHGESELYVSGYRSEVLDRWAARLRDWAERGLDVYVYFDNDAEGRAPHDALELAARV